MRLSTYVMLSGVIWFIALFVFGETSSVRTRTGSAIWRLISGVGGMLLIWSGVLLVLLGH